MENAKEIIELDGSVGAVESAANILRGRFDEIIGLSGAVINSEDIEAVHDMRVATRRLRSALRNFAPVLKKRPLKKINRDLKNLADALGAARDQDVAIAALAKLQAKAENTAVKDGIGKLIDARRSVRERAQVNLLETLAVSEIEKLQERFAASIDEAVQKKKDATVVSFHDAGRRAIEQAIREFSDLSASLYNPFEIKKLHELRIAAKRLRYAIELFAVCWGDQITPLAKEIAEMQTFLGELHDADIWIEDLSRSLRKNNEVEIQTNLRLLSEFVKDRTKNYRGAIELWSDWKNNSFIEKLREMLSQETFRKA